MLCNAGVEPDEITGIYRFSAIDHDYSIRCKFPDRVDNLIEMDRLTARNDSVDVMKMTEQIVNLRVHCLPLYFDNIILKEIFEQ